jgi:hypothetical protein
MEQRRSEKLGRLGEASDVVESGLGVMPFIGMGEGEARGLGGCPSVVSGQHSNWLFCKWKGETERWPHISEEEGSKRAICGMSGKRQSASARAQMVVVGSASKKEHAPSSSCLHLSLR